MVAAITGSKAITGDKKLQKILKRMRTTAARRTMTAGAAEACKQLSKMIKSEVPSRYKTVRKAIAWRRLKVREAPDGGAKVGGRVGRGSKAYARGAQPGRRGVGIGARNIHWFIKGTQRRVTGESGGVIRRTGAMPPQIAPVKVIAMRNRSRLRAVYVEGARRQLKKEVAKGKAF